MSAPAFSIVGHPGTWYVYRLHTNNDLDEPVGGPYEDRAYAEAEKVRLQAPYPAEGIVFSAASQEPGVNFEVSQVGVCVSLKSAQQALDAYLKERGGVAQATVWQAVSAGPVSWQRNVLWQDGDALMSTWQHIQRMHVRKEDK